MVCRRRIRWRNGWVSVMASRCSPGHRERRTCFDVMPSAQRRWREAAGTQGVARDRFANGCLGKLRIEVGFMIALAVLPFVDGRDLLDPSQPVGMLEIDDRLLRPMKVISDEGYLLVERLQGVA